MTGIEGLLNDAERALGAGNLQGAVELLERAATERPEGPDPYAFGIGLTKVSGKTDYAPVRALIGVRD